MRIPVVAAGRLARHGAGSADPQQPPVCEPRPAPAQVSVHAPQGAHPHQQFPALPFIGRPCLQTWHAFTHTIDCSTEIEGERDTLDLHRIRLLGIDRDMEESLAGLLNAISVLKREKTMQGKRERRYQMLHALHLVALRHMIKQHCQKRSRRQLTSTPVSASVHVPSPLWAPSRHIPSYAGHPLVDASTRHCLFRQTKHDFVFLQSHDAGISELAACWLNDHAALLDIRSSVSPQVACGTAV